MLRLKCFIMIINSCPVSVFHNIPCSPSRQRFHHHILPESRILYTLFMTKHIWAATWQNQQNESSLGAQSFCWLCHEAAHICHMKTTKTQSLLRLFVCFHGPVKTIKVISSWSVNLSTLFLPQGRLPKRLTSTKWPSSVTDNCPTWISGRERMAEEFISWPNLCWKYVAGLRIEPTTSLIPVGSCIKMT